MSRPTPIHGFTTGEVCRLLGLSPGQVRSWVRSGLLAPRRGRRREYRFTFQDLVLLRTAKALAAARVPARRVRQALERLRQQLPRGRPLTSVHVEARGGDVVVHDGGRAWEPLSGQAVLGFAVSELASEVEPLAREKAQQARDRRAEMDADAWFELGCELEATAEDEARDAYRRALALDPHHAGAHLNLGRLLHETGRLAAAEEHYRQAVAAHPDDATAHFNLGVALEDAGRPAEAAAAYRRTLELDPAYADAHYNLSGLLERSGEPQAALRHLKEYRRLLG